MGHQTPTTLKTHTNTVDVLGPSNEPWQVELKDPAISVMTDFRVRAMFKVSADETIDEALHKMKVAGLRIAFVTDKSSEKILGTITSYDILGEKPMRYLQSVGFAEHSGVTHRDIVVGDIMEKPADWVVSNIADVEHANVQAVVEAFQKTGRTHLLVVEDEANGSSRLRGLFSSAKVLRLTSFSRQKKA